MLAKDTKPYVWRILLVDDDEDDYFLTREMLAAARKGKFILEWEQSYSAGMEAIQSDTYDAILVDFDMGTHTGTELIREANAWGCRAPLILLTGRGSYEVDLEAMQAGAADYLSKGEVNAALLERSIRYAIERKRVEEEMLRTNDELQQERSRLKTIIENTRSGIILTDREGNFILSNPAVAMMFNGGLTGNVDRPAGGYTLLHLDGTPFTADELPLPQSLQNGVSLQNVEILIRHDTGRELIVLINSSPVFDAMGSVSGSVAVVSDITELRRLERQQIDTQAQMVVQRRLMQYREMERLEIARDLHDGPIQDLLAININLADAIEGAENSEYREKAQMARKKLQEQISELRRFCHELRPPTLAPFGLEKAIRSHISAFEERFPDVEIRLDLDSDRRILPEETRMALFRIYQELLNNINKHAQAKCIDISLRVEDEQVRLEIADNGVGFRVPTNWIEQAHGGHLGLIGMRERAEAVGGELVIESAPGSGTHVSITVPRVENGQ